MVDHFRAGNTQLTKWILITGGMFCAAAVIVGAFGAHALKPVLDAKALDWIDTGVFYHTSHGLALITCGLLPGKGSTLTAILFIVGILLFSGSLYLMALTANTAFAVLTPLGGGCFIAGWMSFCWMVWSFND